MYVYIHILYICAYVQREPLFPTLSSISTTRPNVTMVQPFKSPSLSPINHDTNPPSPTFFDRTSTSPLHRSPSQLSLQQRNLYQPPSTRPLSINSGTALSSSIKSTSSIGSPSGFPKFSSSFNHHKYGSTTRDGSFSSRRRSRSSLTNKSDGSTSERGSYNSVGYKKFLLFAAVYSLFDEKRKIMRYALYLIIFSLSLLHLIRTMMRLNLC